MLDSTYYLQNPGALRAARTGAVTVSTGPYTDHFGSFMSGFAPIRDCDGTLVGFVGIDFSLAQLRDKEFPLQLTYLLGRRTGPEHLPRHPQP